MYYPSERMVIVDRSAGVIGMFRGDTLRATARYSKRNEQRLATLAARGSWRVTDAPWGWAIRPVTR